MPFPYKTIGALGAGAAIGSGALSPEDAEAMSRAEAYAKILRVLEGAPAEGGFAGRQMSLLPQERRTLRDGLRQIPDQAFDSLNDIKHMSELVTDVPFQASGFAAEAVMNPTLRGNYWNSKTPDEFKNVKYNVYLKRPNEFLPPRDPYVALHEIPHHVYDRLLSGDDTFKMNLLADQLDDRAINDLQKAVRVKLRDGDNITSPQELFAEASRRFLVKDFEKFDLFPDGIKDMVKKYSKPLKALSIAALGATMSNADEADAAPFLKLPSGGARALSQKFSTASKDLAGLEIAGKTVKEVRAAEDSSLRYVIYHDKTYQAIPKEQLKSMIRGVGTERYMNKFNVGEPEEKDAQALKSLQIRLKNAEQVPLTRRDQFQAGKAYNERLRDLDMPRIDHVLFQAGDKIVRMPRPYAERLVKLKQGVILPNPQRPGPKSGSVTAPREVAADAREREIYEKLMKKLGMED